MECARCKKEILDGRDEETCLRCNAVLCYECYQTYWICKECEFDEQT